jgi:hypothetical protein
MVILFPVILFHRLYLDLGTILLLSENLELKSPVTSVTDIATHVSILIIVHLDNKIPLPIIFFFSLFFPEPLHPLDDLPPNRRES